MKVNLGKYIHLNRGLKNDKLLALTFVCKIQNHKQSKIHGSKIT